MRKKAKTEFIFCLDCGKMVTEPFLREQGKWPRMPPGCWLFNASEFCETCWFQAVQHAHCFYTGDLRKLYAYTEQWRVGVLHLGRRATTGRSEEGVSIRPMD